MLEKDAVCVFIKKAKNMSALAGEAEKVAEMGTLAGFEVWRYQNWSKPNVSKVQSRAFGMCQQDLMHD